MKASALCPWLEQPFAKLAQAEREGRLAHAWLITGPDGVGKLNLAYALAARLLRGGADEHAPPVASPRAVIQIYAALADPSSPHADLQRVRADEGKRTIRVEQVRDLIRNLDLTPHLAGCKVVIIESADSMTTEAANALLKTLEEPTPNTYLILTSARPGRLSATIRSRCQRLSLTRPQPETVRAWLDSDALSSDTLPPGLLAKPPIRLLMDLMDDTKIKQYKEIYDDINAISKGVIDPHELVDRWQKGDLELALSCLVDALRQIIRRRLVPALRNGFTDVSAALPQNLLAAVPNRALFGQLEMAENLRDQFGRGINMELALKVLLLGLVPPDSQRLKT